MRSTTTALSVVLLLLSFGALSGAEFARKGAKETALDRYVAKPDSSYQWKLADTVSDDGGSACLIDLTSQTWLTPKEVNRPEWKHWLWVLKPNNLAHPTALLIISGGANDGKRPAAPSRELAQMAKATKSVVAELRMVPNQFLVFNQDGKERKEDDLIAYTWDKFLRTGDERWPARLPMTKAVVRAMDTVTAFLASAEGGGAKVDSFVVAGASKRGWTTWATAAVDTRVKAICPIVIDVLNTEPSMIHHYRAYGFYAPAVGDYVRHGIMEWSGTPEMKALYEIEDPLAYRDRFTMPKLIMNACGDQFFLPDSSQFYFDQLPGVKYLRYVPNTDHSLKNSDAMETLRAWHHAILNQTALPVFSWKQEADGSVTVQCDTPPKAAMLWQANNPTARDFRLMTIGPVWQSSPLAGTTVNGKTAFRAQVAKPEKGWTAHLVELTYDLGAGVPLKLTTGVKVIPEVLPHAAPTPARPRGFLAK